MAIINRPTARGYTLIEIVTVIAIFAIVSAIALPQFGCRDDVKTASAAREITADLLYAQSRAIATGKTHYVVFEGGDGYRLMDAMIPPHVILQPTSRTPYEVHYGNGPLSGVTPAQINFDGNATLAFDPAGVPYTWSPDTASLSPLIRGSLVLKSGETTLILAIEPLTGAINIR